MARGWITGEIERDGGYPEREVFRVTDEGEEAHRALQRRYLATLVEGTHPVAALLTQLDDLDEAERRGALETLLDERRRRLRALETFPAHEGLAGASLASLQAQVTAEVATLESLVR